MSNIPIDEFNFYFDVLKQNYDDRFYLEAKTTISKSFKVLDGKIVNNNATSYTDLIFVPNTSLNFTNITLLSIDDECSLSVCTSLDSALLQIHNPIYEPEFKDLHIANDYALYLRQLFNESYPDLDLIVKAFLCELNNYEQVLNHWIDIKSEIIESEIRNSAGLELEYKEVRNFLRLTVLVKVNGVYNSATFTTTFRTLDDLDIARIVLDLVKEAGFVYQKLDFIPQKYDLLFSNKVVSKLIPNLICRILSFKPDLIKKIKPNSDLAMSIEPRTNFYNSNRFFDDRLMPSATSFFVLDKKINYGQDLANLGFYFIDPDSPYHYIPGVFKILNGDRNIDLSYSDSSTFIHVLDFNLYDLKYKNDSLTFSLTLSGYLVVNKEIKGYLTFVVKDDAVSFLNRISHIYNDRQCFCEFSFCFPSFTPSLLFRRVSCYNTSALNDEPYFFDNYLHMDEVDDYL